MCFSISPRTGGKIENKSFAHGYNILIWGGILFRYLIKRILILIPIAFLVSVIIFGTIKIMPGDPVALMLPPDLTPEQYELSYQAMHEKLGLDKDIATQYFAWIGGVLSGDFGYSNIENRPVSQVIAEPMKNTLILNIGVNFLYLFIAIPVGVKCATKRFSLFDNSWQIFSLITYSTPSFFIGILLIYIFSVTLGVLPLGGMPNTSTLEGMELFVAWVRVLILPTITLTIVSLAGAVRYIRNAMIDAISQDYIRTARAKGLSEKVVIYCHALRNAMIPISYIIVGTLFSLFAGSAIVESIFGYNGIGKLIIEGVLNRDNQLVATLNLFYAMISLIAVVIADIVYAAVDPRIKFK